MGFDNECILNIQSLAGEYFCPVCRLLVYPNEALQSQCTHLYCKPCLTYIVGTTRACPYDGYLVTEADSKPLLESNKALAETIGKIAVHCLYHRSGCQWQGPLSECTSHCSGCAFGNSPVVCNRCGIQIVHRQVQEHAQNCPGVQTQAPQIEGVQDTAATATSANAKQTQNVNQSGASASQAQTSQTVAAVTAPPSGQDPNLQANANSQVHAVASAAVPTPEQWYQQQYQQYYQQYPGYDPYQQPYQTYYPNQQQAIQQYQQHPPHMMGQQQPQIYSQPQPQPQPQPLPQPQTHIQSQPQVQPQAPPPPQTQPQTQIQPHAQPQPLQHVHAPVVAQASVNPQHQLHPVVQPPAQMQSQAHPPQPHGHPQPQPYAGAQTHPQPHPIQPHSQQHIHISQYQQPQAQMQHTQAQIQPQTQSLPQMQPQIPLQAQPQSQLPHPHPQLHPPPSFNQHTNPNAQPQTQPPLANAVTGHQSFPQPQVQQQMQFSAQPPPQMHPQGGSIPQHPIQLHGQFPQQPPQMRPPQSHAPVPNQQRPVLLPPQVKVPSMPPGQQQPIHSHAQQPGHPGHQRPVMQPMQQPVPQQHLQHQQPFPGQPSGTVQNQLHPHGHFVQQQQQSQLRPQAPPHSVQQNSLAYMSSQQNAAPSHGLPPHQSQNYAARPMMLNHGTQSLPFSQSPAGFSAAAQVRPVQIGANQPTNQNYPPRTNNQLHISSEQQIVQSGPTLKPTGLERQGEHMPEKSVADQKDGLSSEKAAAQKDISVLIPTSGPEADSVEVKNFKSETDVQKPIGVEEDNNSKVEMYGKDAGSELHAGGNTSVEPAIKHIVKKEANESRLESSSGGKSIEIVAAERKDATDVPQRGERSTANDTSSQQAESVKEQVGKLPKDVVDAGMLVSGGADQGSQAISLASAHIPDSSAQFQERNSSQSQPMPQGPGVDEFRSFPSHGQVQGKGFMHPTHPFPPTDPGRHQHMPVHYGPSTHQQRPSGAAMLQSALPPGPPLHAQVPGQPPNVLRSQGPGDLPPPGQPLNPPDHFLPPVLKQPHGSFHPEIASGGILGPSSASFGRGPSHFGPPERTFESQSVAPQGHYNQGHAPPLHAGFPRMSQGENPGSFNSLGGIMGRAPPYGAEGQIGPQRPTNPIGSEIFSDQRSHHLDGRQPDSHLPGSFERAPFGQSPGIESNMMRMNEVTGTDSSSKVGLHDERFKRLKEEGLNRIPIEPARRVDRGEFEDMKQFPRHPHLDTEPSAKFGSHHSSTRLNDREPHGFSVDAVSRPLDKAPHGLNYETGLKLDPGAGGAPRFLPPYHPGGSNDAGDRARPVGPDAIGRGDSIRTHPDFLRPVPGFGQHHMDRLAPRSPGREYPGFPARDFGGLSGYPRNQSGLDDFEGRESRPFGEGPRSFNFPSGPVGNSFPESRFPLLPGHLRRVEFDGPGNVRRSDLNGQDILPSHLRRGEILGPRNLPGHLRFGEPAGFGAFPGHARMGDLDGSGNLPHQLPFGEPFGGNKSGHPRLGEPGFRSSYSLTGGMDPFDNSRKRKPASMGWCRICKIDCETVEGLDLHSQTREHQKVAMDMVISIKQQNAKKQKTSNDHSSLEEPSKSRGSGYEVHGNKP